MCCFSLLAIPPTRLGRLKMRWGQIVPAVAPDPSRRNYREGGSAEGRTIVPERRSRLLLASFPELRFRAESSDSAVHRWREGTYSNCKLRFQHSMMNGDGVGAVRRGIGPALARVQELMPLYCVRSCIYPVVLLVVGGVVSLTLPLSVPSPAPAEFPSFHGCSSVFTSLSLSLSLSSPRCSV